MKTKLLFAIASAVLLAACSKNPSIETPESETADYTGTVSVEYEGEIFDNEDIKVHYVLSDDGKAAEILIYRIKFVPKMPVRVDVTIPDIQVVRDGGRTLLYCDDLNPLALGGEYPKYRVHNFEGEDSDHGLQFSLLFGEYPTWFSGSR